MAGRQSDSPGSVEDHPDFSAIFEQARDEVWGEFAPRYERAVTSGNIDAAERIQARVDERARARAAQGVQALNGLQSGRGSAFSILSRTEIDPNLTMGDVQSSRPAPETLLGSGPAPRPRGEFLPTPLPDLPSRSPNAVEVGEGLQTQSRPEARELAQDASSFGQGANVVVGTALSHPAARLGKAVVTGVRGAAEIAAPVARHVASNPAAYGLGIAGTAAMAAPAETQAPTFEDRVRRSVSDEGAQVRAMETQLGTFQQQIATLQEQRKATLDEMRAQREGSGGGRAGMGPRYRAQEDALTRLDQQIKETNASITSTTNAMTQSRTRMTPEYQERLRQIYRAEESRDSITAASALPFREEFPKLSRMWFAAPFAAGVAVTALTKLPPAVASNRQVARWWESVNAIQATSNPTARARALVRAEELEKAIPEHTWRDIAGYYAGPLLGGASAGAAMANMPEFYDMFTLPLRNPERRALEEYVKLLPEDHPEVRRLAARIASLPEDNPDREAAIRHFTRISPALARSIEGALGGMFGAELVTGGAHALSRHYEAALPRPETRAALRNFGPQSRSQQGSQPLRGETSGPRALSDQSPEGSGSRLALPPPSSTPARGQTESPPRGTSPGGQPPSTPPSGATGARETWVSPSGETKFIDATGRWQNREGFTSPPDPRKWRRISSLHDNIELFGGYPVA